MGAQLEPAAPARHAGHLRKLERPDPPIEPQKLAAAGSVFFTRPTLVNYISKREELETRTRDLFAAMRDGKLHVRIGATYPLADAAQAHRDLEARKTVGKLLLLP